MRQPVEKSRFKEHLQKETSRNVIIAIFGIIVLGALLLIFGTNILVGFSLLVGKFSGSEDANMSESQQGVSYIAPPTLNPTVEATSSAAISLSGYGKADQRIDLYRNGKMISKTTVKSNNTFRFTNVTLEEGVNSLKAKAVTVDNKRSNYSNELSVSLLNKSPELSIDFPQDGQGFKKEQSPLKISGKTDPGVKVTVNDFRAIVDSGGNYSYLYNLKDGDNNLKVVATDNAGNQTTKEISIRIE